MPDLAATQRLKQLSQMSSIEPEMSTDHTTGGILQQGRPVVQKMQNDPALQTIADPGKQVLCYF